MRDLEKELKAATSDQDIRDLFRGVSCDFFRTHIKGEDALLGQIGPVARQEGFHYSPRHALEFAETLDRLVPIGTLIVPTVRKRGNPLRYFYYLNSHQERVRLALHESANLQEFKLANLVSQICGEPEKLPLIHDLYDPDQFHRTAVALRKIGLRVGPHNVTVEGVLLPGCTHTVFSMKASFGRNHGSLSYFHHTGEEDTLLEFAKQNCQRKKSI
ncbi:TPA: hypothetical protein DD690_01460 [Candidatus Daviesbacteria bacterium]|nr:MAG: hypothetical protein A3H81_01095 [Candidatus Daviesbacteria bacterium RIFCSPLOWO2_02_FULL_38_18]HBQ50631.1 hypothetical protein [Candidatus Daviesbacteria bacterium]HCB22689.1 hypothetical protein [Candidatus Daviesbacteria bacterium]